MEKEPQPKQKTRPLALLADGRLVDVYAKETPLRFNGHVYTYSDDHVTLAPVRGVTLTTRCELVSITIDDALRPGRSTRLRLRADDQILTLYDGPVRAGDLRPGARLLPFYTRMRGEHVEYFEPSLEFVESANTPTDKNQWRNLSRVTAEYKLKRRLQPDDVVKNVTDDKLNNGVNSIVVRKRKTELDVALDRGRKLLQSIKLENPYLAAMAKAREELNHKVLVVEPAKCFAQGSMLLVVENSVINPVPIERLAIEGPGRFVVGYDLARKLLVKAQVNNIWLTKPAAPVLTVKLSNNRTLRVTPEHKVLKINATDGTSVEYVEAQTLKQGDRVVASHPGLSFTDQTMLTNPGPGSLWVTADPKPDSKPYKVYDLETTTKNLVVDGAVCHNCTLTRNLLLAPGVNFMAGGVFIHQAPSR